MYEAGGRERGDSGGEQRDSRSLASERLPAPECAAPLFSFELKSGSVAALNGTSASFPWQDFDVALRGKTTKHKALVSPLIKDKLIKMCEYKQVFPPRAKAQT